MNYTIILDTPENENESTCPVSQEEQNQYIKVEMSTEKIKRRNFKRVARMDESVWWIWKYYDENNAPCYMVVSKTGENDIEMCTDDTNGLSPEQFLVAVDYRL